MGDLGHVHQPPAVVIEQGGGESLMPWLGQHRLQGLELRPHDKVEGGTKGIEEERR